MTSQIDTVSGPAPAVTGPAPARSRRYGLGALIATAALGAAAAATAVLLAAPWSAAG